ncbi:MAG: hypothetical protein ACL7AX_09940 [Candidatus Arsenophonus phytopathogenicus]
MKKIKNNLNYIIFLLIFLVSIPLNIFVFEEDSRVPHVSTFTILLITFVLIISNNKIKKLIGLFLLFLINFKIVYALYSNGNVTTAVLRSILETNTHETLSMISALFLKLILPSFIITATSFYFIHNIKKNVKNTSLFLYSILFSTIISIILIALDIKNDQRLISHIKIDKLELGVFFQHKIPLVFGDVVYLIISANDDKYLNTAEIEKFNYSIISKRRK